MATLHHERLGASRRPGKSRRQAGIWRMRPEHELVLGWTSWGIRGHGLQVKRVRKDSHHQCSIGRHRKVRCTVVNQKIYGALVNIPPVSSARLTSQFSGAGMRMMGEHPWAAIAAAEACIAESEISPCSQSMSTNYSPHSHIDCISLSRG